MRFVLDYTVTTRTEFKYNHRALMQNTKSILNNKTVFFLIGTQKKKNYQKINYIDLGLARLKMV